MDARLHHLQRETEFVTSQASALALIEEFHREKLAAMIQHMSHARLEAIPWTRVCISCKQKQNA